MPQRSRKIFVGGLVVLSAANLLAYIYSTYLNVTVEQLTYKGALKDIKKCQRRSRLNENNAVCRRPGRTGHGREVVSGKEVQFTRNDGSLITLTREIRAFERDELQEDITYTVTFNTFNSITGIELST